jgi:hypothetical protein
MSVRMSGSCYLFKKSSHSQRLHFTHNTPVRHHTYDISMEDSQIPEESKTEIFEYLDSFGQTSRT